MRPCWPCRGRQSAFSPGPAGASNWIYELKHDGFRGIQPSIASRHGWYRRKGKKFRQFDPLLRQILRSLKGQRAILDGEIVVLDEKGFTVGPASLHFKPSKIVLPHIKRTKP